MTENTISRLYNSVSFTRGLGDSGRKITIEEIDCEYCGHDRLIRDERVNPEHENVVEYHCRHPNCPDHKPAKRIIPSI